MAKQTRLPMTYELKISLRAVEPAVWRKIIVPEFITLDELEELIQLSMGWESYHDFYFEIDGQRFMPTTEERGYSDQFVLDTNISMVDVLKNVENFTYIYDLGDGWVHDIEVVRHAVANLSMHYPICIGGENACPPEDCGGVYGYSEFLEAVTDPKHKRHKELLSWYGGYFDPKGFSANFVNRLFWMDPEEEGADSPQRDMDF